MRDRRDAAQQILHGTMDQPLITRNAPRYGQRVIGMTARIDIRYPLADIGVVLAETRAWKYIELQVIVRVDQAGKQARALKPDDHISRCRRRTQRGDTRRANAERACRSSGDFGI